MNEAGDLALDELLAKDGFAFVQACYRTILNRDADEAGERHHLDLLAKGTSKLAIVVALAESEECKGKGLHNGNLLIAARKRALTWKGVLKGLLKRGRDRAGAATVPCEAKESPQVPLPYQLVSIPADEWAARMTASSAVGDAFIDERTGFRNFWFDLTTSLQWSLGVVGIIRAELEMASNLKKLYPNLRFSMQAGHGFAEISETQLQWLLRADNVAEAYMEFFGRKGGQSHQVRVDVPEGNLFFHPYGPKDLIFSMGWKDSQKERLFSTLKEQVPEVVLSYLIYDIIMLRPQTRHFYAERDRAQFESYLKWISYTCDFLLFGGENTKSDVEAWQRDHHWPTLPGRAIQFGSDIVEAPRGTDDDRVLAELGVSKPYVLAVGTSEPRKNYSTLYRAYLLARDMSEAILPQMVICGQDGHRVHNLHDQMARDPRVKGRILRLTPSDDDLSVLYRNCLFTLLPSFYEGWSLTLPESFAYGKLCLCADTPPLREIGADLAEFIDPIDVMAWSRALIAYAGAPDVLAQREQRITSKWRMTTWADAAQLTYDGLVSLHSKHAADHGQHQGKRRPPVIWMDLTLSYLNWNSSLSGVTRVELMYAKTLRKIAPSTRFFACDSGNFFEIDPSYLTWMDDTEDLSQAYNDFHAFWHHHESKGLSFRSPLRNNSDPKSHQAYLEKLPSGSVAFFAGIDFGFFNEAGEPQLTYTHLVERLRPKEGRLLLAHFMHDFTPSDWPQIHKSETVDGYEPFCNFISNRFDYLVYGGITAQRDGEALQKRRGWKVPSGDPVALGFDIKPGSPLDPQDDRAYLKELGVTSDFVIAVGTLEPRKNHETLYRAYLLMQQRGLLNKPLQMIFVGKPGWNNDDFLTTLAADERVKGGIITVNPSDRGLDVLYRRALFTLLPSFYEGWSLPLPESLAYGKFCLVSDTPPLRERGGNFVEYIHPLDAASWAERIAFYANDPNRLIALEQKINTEWRPVSWVAATEMLMTKLYSAYDAAYAVGDEEGS